MVGCPTGIRPGSRVDPWLATRKRALLSTASADLAVASAFGFGLADGGSPDLGEPWPLRFDAEPQRWSLCCDGGGRLFSSLSSCSAQVFEGHYPHVWAACWYPWAFLGFRSVPSRRWGRAWTLAPIPALALLTGHPQEWFYLLFVLSLWAGWMRSEPDSVGNSSRPS